MLPDVDRLISKPVVYIRLPSRHLPGPTFLVGHFMPTVRLYRYDASNINVSIMLCVIALSPFQGEGLPDCNPTESRSLLLSHLQTLQLGA
jgi:hypothetical protein